MSLWLVVGSDRVSESELEQVDGVYQPFPPTTLPRDVSELATKFTTDPVHTPVERERATLEDVKQFFLAAEREGTEIRNTRLFDASTNSQVIVLCDTGQRVSRSLFQIVNSRTTFYSPNFGSSSASSVDCAISDNGATSLNILTLFITLTSN